MKFLVPTGGDTFGAHGVLTSYKHRDAPAGVVCGLPWAGDNCAFSGFDAERFEAWLWRMVPYRTTCLFVAVPDVVGDAQETLKRYAEWREHMTGWPLAYVAQDGSEGLPIPGDCAAVFIGGSTEWKLSDAAVSVIRRAQESEKHVHIGRVNWWRRYSHFRVLVGSDDFTCDGTRTRFEGRERTLRAWKHYESQEPLLRL